MFQRLTFSQFLKRFPTNDSCLEEIKRTRYPKGIRCQKCKRITNHYRISSRPAYGCIICRKQTFPLAGTIFKKSTTPLRLWFYAIFLLTHTRGEVTATQLQKELGVTYKTAWRINNQIHKLMQPTSFSSSVDADGARISKVHKWVFFKHFEIAVVEREQIEEDG